MLWMLPLALAAAGALADKEKPLRGAAIGAGIGLTGGAAAGALGAGAAGAGAAGTAAGAGAAGAGTAGAGIGAGSGLLAAEGAGAAGGGLLGGSGLSGSLVGSGALTSSGANAAALGGSNLGGSLLTSGALAPSGAEAAALGAGGGVAAEQAAAPVVDKGSSAGLLDKANFQTGGNYDNIMKTGKNANSVYSQYEQNKPQQPVAQPMPLQNKPLDLSPIINDSAAMREYDMSENERRRREMQRYAQFAGGY